MVRARAGSDDGGGLLRLLHASGGLLSPRMLYKAMRGLLWSLWGLIQYVNGQPLIAFVIMVEPHTVPGMLIRNSGQLGSLLQLGQYF